MRAATFPLDARFILIGLVVCGCLPGSGAPGNFQPIADAGADATVIMGDTVTLSGSATDFENDPLTFAWRIISRPIGSVCAIDNPSAQNTFFEPDMPGQYQLGLTANDGGQNSAEATVLITANANTPPIAEVGADMYMLIGGTASLDGSSSSDGDGHALTFAWAVTSAPGGSTASLSDPTIPTPSITPDATGDYTIELVVNDGYVNSAPAALTLHVTNATPTAVVGNDQNATVGFPVSFDGSSSSDGDGHALTFAWAVTSAPGGSTASLSDPTIPTPSITPDATGDYTIELVVNDGYVSSAPATLILHVTNATPTAVVANDRYVLVGVAATLDGSGSSDTNGHGLTFAWAVTSAPGGSTASLNDPTIPTPSITPDVTGDYTIELVVSDGYDNSVPANLIVHAVNNIPPACFAGTDQSKLLGDTIILYGGGLDPEGDPFTLSWTFSSKPIGSLATLDDPSIANPRFVADVVGTYVLALVADDGAARPADEVIIEVAPNLPPIAYAGVGLRASRDYAAYCSGYSSYDPENRFLIYSWTLISQPVGGTAALSDSDTYTPWFTPDVVGEYTLELVVNDGFQDSLPSSVVVTVTDNQTPIASAGTDIGIMTGFAVELYGHGSWDPDNDLLDFEWSIQSRPVGSAASIYSVRTKMQPSFTPDLPGDYVIELVVSDGNVTSLPDSVTISVSDTPLPPTVEGGGNQLALAGFTYSFGDWASFDPNNLYTYVDYDLPSTPLGPAPPIYDGSYDLTAPGTYLGIASISSAGFLVEDLFTIEALDVIDSYYQLLPDNEALVAVVGDVTADGTDDLVLVTDSSTTSPSLGSKLLVYICDSGGLTGPTIYPMPSIPDNIGSGCIGDVTGDGLNDVVIGCQGGDIHVFPQTLTGELGAPSTYTSAFGQLVCMEIGDFNNDGLLDVVSSLWGHWKGQRMEIFLQLPDGTLAPPETYAFPDIINSGYNEICKGDLNGDGLTDIALMSGQGWNPNVAVLYQSSSGTLGNLRYFDPGGAYNINGSGAHDVDIGDVDGDGRDDLVVLLDSDHFAVLSQLPNGTLSAPALFECLSGSAVRIMDVDGNGKTDIVVSGSGWATSVYLQNGLGQFSSASVLPSYLNSHYSGALSSGDLNADGLPDIVVADRWPYGVKVFFSRGTP